MIYITLIYSAILLWIGPILKCFFGSFLMKNAPFYRMNLIQIWKKAVHKRLLRTWLDNQLEKEHTSVYKTTKKWNPCNVRLSIDNYVFWSRMKFYSGYKQLKLGGDLTKLRTSLMTVLSHICLSGGCFFRKCFERMINTVYSKGMLRVSIK